MVRPSRRTIGTVATVGVATIVVVAGLAIAAPTPLDSTSDDTSDDNGDDDNGAIGAAGDRDGDTIPDAVECPAPASQPLRNGSFEQPSVDVGGFAFFEQTDVDGWSTSATDGLIEIWNAHRGVIAADGRQFAEVNATRSATLYADVATQPGETLEWSLVHRGRAGDDTITIAAGAVDTAPTSLRTVTSGPDDWNEIAGRYNVPTGQAVTRFSLISELTAGRDNAGNLVDAIVLRPVERDTDLDGTPDCDDGDSDNDGALDENEAGPHPATPIDSDGDGTPDYRQATNRPSITLNDDVAAGVDGALVTLDVGANDSAPLGSRLVFDVVRPAAAAITRLDTDGLLELMLDPNVGGDDSMQYRACLAHDVSVCSTATVDISAEVTNDAPVADDDFVDDGLADGSVFGWPILDNDTDGDGQLDVGSLRIVVAPTIGSAEIVADELVYTTPTEMPGRTIDVIYEVCDDGDPARCDQATVFIDLTERPPDEL